jgi:hypothetical protein
MVYTVLTTLSAVWGAIVSSGVLATLLGFVVAWATFELTERRKRWIARNSFRSAVIAELEYAEVLLSTTAFKYADTAKAPRDVERMAREARWFWREGREKAKEMGHNLVAADDARLAEQCKWSDERIIAGLVRDGVADTLANEIRFPLVEAGLGSALGLGLSSDALRDLSALRQQTYLLSDTARFMKEWFDKIASAPNTDVERVRQNHEHARAEFRKKTLVVLDFVRKAAVSLR